MTQEHSTFLQCPACGKYAKTWVKDCRRQHETNRIRRRRQCSSCGGRYTTYESIGGMDRVQAKKVKALLIEVQRILERIDI